MTYGATKMTWGEFKLRLEYLSAGGHAMKDRPKAIITFLRPAFDEILTSCEPLALITQDISRFTPRTRIDDTYFIRDYTLPDEETPDSYVMDLDGKLVEAALDLICYYMSHRDTKVSMPHMQESLVKRDQYNVEKYGYLRDIRFYETGTGGTFKPNNLERWDVPILLDAFGYLKYYMVFRSVGETGPALGLQHVDGFVRRWELRTVDLLDMFMAKIFLGESLSKSQEVLWDQFCRYQDDIGVSGPGVSEDPEEKALAILNKIYMDRVFRRIDVTDYYPI